MKVWVAWQQLQHVLLTLFFTPASPEVTGHACLLAATLEPGLVRVEDLRPGLDCIPEGPAAGWVPRAPCDASSAIKQRWVRRHAM
jgi:hypothetical protein